jgi:serine/threonine protein kinase
MGRVWQAWDTYLERTVAVKEVHLRTGPGATDANVRAMRDARAAAKIDNKGIVTVHDVVEHRHRPGRGHHGLPGAGTRGRW